MRGRAFGILLVVAACAAAAAQVDAADTESSAVVADSAPVAKEDGAARATNKVFDFTLESLSATRLRPLFARDRSPPRPAAAPVGEQQASEPQEAPREEEVTLSLQGIILRGETRLVILKDHSTSNTIMLRSGERFGRWQVVAENDHSATLISDEGRKTMDIFANPESTINPN